MPSRVCLNSLPKLYQAFAGGLQGVGTIALVKWLPEVMAFTAAASTGNTSKGVPAMGLILLIVLIVLLVGTIPRWSHSRDWGYGPSGGLGLVLVVVLLLLLMGYIPRGF